MKKEEILNHLYSNVVEVKFKKKDGSDRTMICTLMEQHLPRVPRYDSETPRKRPDDLISVYDLEKMAWRSFHVDSVYELNDTKHP